MLGSISHEIKKIVVETDLYASRSTFY